MAITGRVLWIVGVIIAGLGCIWAATFYLSQSEFPIATIGAWNLLVAFWLFVIGAVILASGVTLERFGRRSAPTAVQ